ncbi:hypothetical protein [Candidatus Nitronereus thalassa]|uniref:Uncharacterized protein n=1 Tax=Candidatus Nitronereus thalassa TaxID=3020898 RepID=A0ABU3K2Y4_9BACT|nr:hypothetical protein [Candidatus Nitronereus thalassa]MDT7040745.1 hypothetical protein [Candidatus Nitronereus thalassa]
MSRPVKLNVCGCGNLHLTYGFLTLHFGREEFRVFARQINQLAGCLKTDHHFLPSIGRRAC